MTAFQTHPDNDSLRRFLEERLDDPQALEIEGHLEDCDECRASLDRISNSGASLEALTYFSANDNDNVSTHIGSGETKIRDTTVDSGIEFDRSRYIVTGPLAEGGMGVVYRAFDTEIQRDIAIKVGRAGIRDTLTAQRFYREAKISGQLQHPGIVPIHEIGVLSDGRQFIAMKLIEGRTLRQILDQPAEEGVRNLTSLTGIFGQVCEAIAYAHSNGVIHRDLKPENVMVGEFGEVQVMDWGLAKRIVEREPTHDTHVETNGLSNPGETIVGTMLGTPGYMAPEQVQGGLTDKSSDVFSLGAILFEILTGVAPFGRISSTGRAEKNTRENIEGLLGQLNNCAADEGLVSIAAKSLAFRPSDRFPDGEVLNARMSDWTRLRDQRLRESELETARTAARMEEEKLRRSQRFRLVTVIAGILGLTAIATMLYLNERIRRNRRELNVKEEHVSQVRKSEDELRTIISRAVGHQLDAMADPDRVTADSWRLAISDLKQGEPLLERIESDVLVRRFHELRGQLDSAAFVAERKRSADELASRLQNATLAASNVFDRNAPRKLTCDPEVFEMIEEAFNAYGVKLMADVEQSSRNLKGIINSPADAINVLEGLFYWQEQTENSFEVEDNEFVAVQSWFGRLQDAIDDDPFRREVRDAYLSWPDHKVSGDRLVELANCPESTKSVLNMNWIAACLNRHQLDLETEKFLTRAHRIYPQNFLINSWLATFHRRGDRGPAAVHTALRHLQVCSTAAPRSPGLANTMAHLYLRSNDLDLALEFAKRGVQYEPRSPNAYNQLAMVYGARQEFKEGLIHSLEAIELSPGAEGAHLTNTALLLSLNRLEETEVALDELGKRFPDAKWVYSRKIDLLVKLRRPMEALQVADAALSKFKDERRWRTAATKIYVHLGNWDKVVEYIEPVYQKWPETWETTMSIAEGYLRTGNISTAETALLEIWQYRKSLPKISLLMVEVKIEKGQLQDAKLFLDDFLFENPDNAEGLRLEKRLRRMIESANSADAEQDAGETIDADAAEVPGSRR